ncbi:MAG: hypothetical protein PHE67_07800 [Campylobacterales bacterium]|nr:hypothetical protein [Campylobacterales bacterium]
MKKCGYCKTEKAQGVSDMLSNGYCVCEECSMNQFGKKIAELETMAQAKAKEAAAYRKQKLESGTAVVTKHNVHLYYELMSDEDKIKNKIVFDGLMTQRFYAVVKSLNLKIDWKEDDFVEFVVARKPDHIVKIYALNESDSLNVIGQSFFDTKDTLKPIDEYIREIKESEAYQKHAEVNGVPKKEREEAPNELTNGDDKSLKGVKMRFSREELEESVKAHIMHRAQKEGFAGCFLGSVLNNPDVKDIFFDLLEAQKINSLEEVDAYISKNNYFRNNALLHLDGLEDLVNSTVAGMGPKEVSESACI